MMQHGIWQGLAICETVAKPVARSITSFFFYLLEISFENFLEKSSGRSNVFIISKYQSSLSNKFYDKNQTLQAEAISNTVRIDCGQFCSNSSLWLITSAIKCNRGIYMFHWMLVAPQALKSVLPVEDSFSNKEMRTFSRIREHQSTRKTFNTRLWRKKQSQLLSTTSPLWFWQRIKLVVRFCDKSFLCYGTSCFKNDFSSQCQKEHISINVPAFSGILAGQRAQRPISLPHVIASTISSIVFWLYISTFFCYCTASWTRSVFIFT